MKHRCFCLNCGFPALLPLCWECARLIIVTVVAELVVAAILWGLR